MKNDWLIPALLLVLTAGCKGKKEEKKEESQEVPISAISIIKGQLNKLDSSLYGFMKLERNATRTDTTYIKPKEVRMLAEPFLALPDIADKNLAKKYTEDRMVQADQETFSITSTLKPDEEGEIQRQMLSIGVADPSNAQVNSIFIDTYKEAGDSTIEKKLVWEIDKYFTIYTIVQKANQPEKNYFLKVEWQ